MIIQIQFFIAVFIALTLASSGCHRSDLMPEQRRFQSIAARAFQNSDGAEHHDLIRFVLPVALQPGCKIVTEAAVGDQTNMLSFVTTEPCVLASRSEEPNRHDLGAPLFGDVALIPLTNLEKKITIWSGTNILTPRAYDPAGKEITQYRIEF